MMLGTIKKFVKYGIFESTTDNYDYAIVDNKDDIFYRYYLTDNTITYKGMKLNCYSGSRFFFDNGKIIGKREITCYDVCADYYNESLANYNIRMELNEYSLNMYYASKHGSSSEYLFSCGVTSGIFKIPRGGKKERFYYTKKLQDALFNAYNNANSEAYEIAKILEAPENYFKSCAKLNKLHEEYTQQISTLRNNISTDWDVMNILDNTVIDFKFK